MLTLARLPGLESLNYSAITPQERENAELYYLSRVRAELESAFAEARGSIEEENRAEERVAAQQPRYGTLCAAHGSPAVVRPSSLQPSREALRHEDANSLGSRLVRLTLKVVRLDEEPGTAVAAHVPT
ncbi:MAG: hypothetical protein LQ340_002273, partial [Diploschistes diacapsis]